MTHRCSTSRSGALALALNTFAAFAVAPAADAQVAVTTYHNDVMRSGLNAAESVLTPGNVNSKQFGKLFTTKVDGYVYAEPLVVPNAAIGGGTHDALFVATEHDSVYGIDADTGTIYWQVNLIPAGGRTVIGNTDIAAGCDDVVPEIGITGTPVIDPTTHTLYVVAKALVAGKAVQYLHALDTGTGAEKFGGPVAIAAAVRGTGYDSKNGSVAFQPLQEQQRPGLLLENGHVVIAWTSHCDTDPWHGWVMSYAAGTLAQEAVWNTSPNGRESGIWMSGGGLAADASGNLFLATGNGSWNGTSDFGDSVVKLGPPAAGGFPVLDYFTPYDQASLSDSDNDVGAASPMLLPATASGRQMLAQVSKLGTIYVLDRNALGKYCVTATPACTNSNPQIPQEIIGANNGVWGAPAYWNGNIYWGPAMGRVQAYAFDTATGAVSKNPTSVSSEYFNFPGPTPSVSANGAADAIIWYVDAGSYQSTCSGGVDCAVLYANDATNLGTMLYSSAEAPDARDAVGGAVKFATPTIANGKVYVGAQYAVTAFGELASNVATTAAPVFEPAPASFTSQQSVTLADATPGAVIYYTTNGSTPTTSSARYTGAIPVTATMQILALAVAPGEAASVVAGGTYTISSPSQSGAVNLAAAFATSGIDAIGTDGASIAAGGVDGHGNALSGTLLGTSLSSSGATFAFGPAGAPSGVSGSSGAAIAVPAGNYTALEILAVGVNGNQPDAAFKLNYSDGTSSTVTQSVSDWFTPQHFAGESIALTMAYRLDSTGARQNGPFYLYAYTFAVPGDKTLASLGLPNNRNVVVLALDVTPVTGSAPVSIALNAAANVVGIGAIGTTTGAGGADGHGNAFAESLVGGGFTWSGAGFKLGAADALDAVSNAKIGLPPQHAASLEVIATGVNGPQLAQAFVVTYSDGSTAAFTQSLSDWHQAAHYAGEAIALTTAYRITAGGLTGPGPFDLYAYEFKLDPSKTVTSLTPPKNRNVVVFAVDLTP